jgi:hypothetical protein
LIYFPAQIFSFIFIGIWELILLWIVFINDRVGWYWLESTRGTSWVGFEPGAEHFCLDFEADPVKKLNAFKTDSPWSGKNWSIFPWKSRISLDLRRHPSGHVSCCFRCMLRDILLKAPVLGALR